MESTDDTVSGHIGNAAQLLEQVTDWLEERTARAQRGGASNAQMEDLDTARNLVASAYIRLSKAQALERRRDQAARLVALSGLLAGLEDGRVFQFGYSSGAGSQVAGYGPGLWREVAPVPYTPAWVLAHITNKTPARALDADATGVPHQGTV